MKRYGYVRVSTMKQSIERQIRNIKDKFPDAAIVTDEYTGTKLDRPGWQKIYKAAKPGDVIVFDSVSRMSRDAEEGFQVYEELFKRGVELIFLKEPHINTSVYHDAAEKRIDIQLKSGSDPLDKFGNGMIQLVNELMLDLAKEQIRLAFEQAEKEVLDLRQRTREGIETARLNGKQVGQKKGAELEIKKKAPILALIRKYSKDFDGDLDDVRVMSILKGERVKLEGKLVAKLDDKGDPVKDKDGKTVRVPDEISAKLARGTYYKYKRELKEMIQSSVERSVGDQLWQGINDQLWHASVEAWQIMKDDPELVTELADEIEKVLNAAPGSAKWQKQIDALVKNILKRKG